jgi:uroporphyrin-III C-methyltransferase
VREAGVPVEVIPGISAALGCAAEAMLPLTHRDWSSAVSFVAGQCKGLTEQDWSGLAGKGRTLVIYMGVAPPSEIADKLIADGVAPDMPVAVLERGTPGSPRAAHLARRSRRWSRARRRRKPGDHRRGRSRDAADAEDRLAALGEKQAEHLA